MTAPKLFLIGRERVMIENLTKRLHTEARKHGDYTPIRELRRGNWFEVRLADGRVAKVVVELDRIESAPVSEQPDERPGQPGENDESPSSPLVSEQPKEQQ
jgi:hypothetical protein